MELHITFVGKEVWLDIIGNLLEISDNWRIFVQTLGLFYKERRKSEISEWRLRFKSNFYNLLEFQRSGSVAMHFCEK